MQPTAVRYIDIRLRPRRVASVEMRTLESMLPTWIKARDAADTPSQRDPLSLMSSVLRHQTLYLFLKNVTLLPSSVEGPQLPRAVARVPLSERTITSRVRQLPHFGEGGACRTCFRTFFRFPFFFLAFILDAFFVDELFSVTE